MKAISAFYGYTLVASGALRPALAATKRFLDDKTKGGCDAPAGEPGLLIFDRQSGRQVDFDFRGTVEEVLGRLPSEPALPEAATRTAKGRPRLGVISGEVTLLPRHWEWLASQPSKASGTLRRLVDAAKSRESTDLGSRIDALGSLLWSLAGNLEGFEEASRCLFRKDLVRFFEYADTWPGDLGPFSRSWFEGLPGNGPQAPGCPEPLRRLEGVSDTPQPSKAEAWSLCAHELLAQVQNGKCSARSVVESFLGRISSVGSRVNAIVERWDDEALRAADELDARLARGLGTGPLAGIPFTVKANIDIGGKASSHGIQAMKDTVAPLDAPIVRRMREAGAILLGRTNLPDLSLRFHTDSSLYGATLNPRHPGHSPGGSSGGEGAAIASGQSPLGLGNDAGGSVRIPAVFGGIAALKPTSGRFPSDRSVGPRDAPLASQVIPVEGVLARSVADLHLVYQILSGPDPRDPRAIPAPLWGPAPRVPIRVCLSVDPGKKGTHPVVAGALERAADVLANAGYVIERLDPPRFEEAAEAYGRMIITEFEQSRTILQRLLGEDGRRYIEHLTALRQPVDLAAYLGLTALWQGLRREWAQFMVDHPLLLCPVYLDPYARVGDDIESLESHRRVMHSMEPCSVTSFLGLPAVAVPTGFVESPEPGSIPLGIQIVGTSFREDLCLEAAWQIERCLGRLPLANP